MAKPFTPPEWNRTTEKTPVASNCAAPSHTTRRRTGRRSASSRSCRTSGPTPAPTAPTTSGYEPCRAGSTATITVAHTAASAGPAPPPACKQATWELHLESARCHQANKNGGAAKRSVAT